MRIPYPGNSGLCKQLRSSLAVDPGSCEQHAHLKGLLPKHAAAGPRGGCKWQKPLNLLAMPRLVVDAPATAPAFECPVPEKCVPWLAKYLEASWMDIA